MACWIVSKYLALPSVPSVSFEGIEIAVGSVDSPGAKFWGSVPASGASVVSAAGIITAGTVTAGTVSAAVT